VRLSRLSELARLFPSHIDNSTAEPQSVYISLPGHGDLKGLKRPERENLERPYWNEDPPPAAMH
jgi:hypothetical protein